jgi:hypothetical protein
MCSVVLILLPTLNAHPVPRKSHDRTVVVRVTPTCIVVDYRLEIDEWTVVYVDLPALDDKVDITKLKKPEQFYDAFTKCYAPILAKNLSARLDAKEIEFRCVQKCYRVAEHLQCDFRFEAACDIEPGKEHALTFREGNYELESGMLRLSIGNHPEAPMLAKNEPDDALKNRPPSELRPGDDEKLRKASATFEVERAIERPGTGNQVVAHAKPSPPGHVEPGKAKTGQ